MAKLYIWLAPALVTILELLLVIAAVVLILISSKGGPNRRPPPAFHSLERAFVRLSRRRNLSILMVGILVVAIRLALNPVLGVPQPRWNDEFSYLLAADTFAHGRLTNSTHPMWIHFESFHIIEQPTYMSMYAPAEGLVLAAGQLMGNPWIGQLLVTALMCSTLCWMLQGWLPPPWALFGAGLALLRLCILSYWMNGYWSASIVALGGALVFGAWPRLRRHLRVRDALFMALGVAILANSRPYDGLIFSIPVAVAMLSWLIGRNHPAFGRSVPRLIVPIFLVLLVAALGTGYYNYRVTGNPFRLPYQVNHATYGRAPYFLYQTPLPEPVYHHQVMRDFYRWDLGEFENNFTIAGYLRHASEKIGSWWQFYLGPLLTLPLLAFPLVVRQRKMRLPLLICGAMAAGFAVETWTLPHYFAPATGALYLLLVQGMRYLWQWSPSRRPMGQSVVRAIPVLACAMIVLRVTAVFTHTHIEPVWPRGNLDRAALVQQLRRLPGLQLVFVSYGTHHDADHEWVYNDADIDSSKVVWARNMGKSDNQELLQYFGGRKVWLVEGDSPAPRLVPYPTDDGK